MSSKDMYKKDLAEVLQNLSKGTVDLAVKKLYDAIKKDGMNSKRKLALSILNEYFKDDSGEHDLDNKEKKEKNE